MKKVCKECKENKNIIEFGNLTRSKDGKKAKCKKCASAYNKAHPISKTTKDSLNKKRKTDRRTDRINKIQAGEIRIFFEDEKEKECTICNIIKIKKEFSRNRDKLISHCKSCEKVRYKKWYDNGGYEKVKAYQETYRVNNHKKVKIWNEISISRRTKEKKIEILKNAKKWREKNKDKMSMLKKNWRKLNPLKDFEYNHKRRDRIGNKNISATEIKKLLDSSNMKCYWCDVSVKNKYHLDHYIPLSKGGENKIENIVISCPGCNLSKGAKDPIEFAQKNGKLL